MKKMNDWKKNRNQEKKEFVLAVRRRRMKVFKEKGLDRKMQNM